MSVNGKHYEMFYSSCLILFAVEGFERKYWLQCCVFLNLILIQLDPIYLPNLMTILHQVNFSLDEHSEKLLFFANFKGRNLLPFSKRGKKINYLYYYLCYLNINYLYL